MAIWLPCGDGFIVADVIRWREGIWERRGPRSGRALKVGDREVIAEVLSGPDEEGWVILLVVDCLALACRDGHLPRSGLLKAGHEMKRKASTIQRGRVERMAWSDEAARRAVIGSKFMRRKPVRSAPQDDARGN